MEINFYLDRYKLIRYNFFKWRYETNLFYKTSLAFCFACLIGLASQFRFYLPNNPAVPITGQTFAVLLAGILLGKWGVASISMYMGIGVAGVPWFAPKIGMPIFSNGGIGAITGATSGYLIGFIFAALFLGFLTERYIGSRNFSNILLLMLFANFVLIYIPGLLALYLWWSYFVGSIGFIELITIGIMPFLLGDILKIFTAAAVATSITPKTSFGKEVDGAK
jgi:biotin transport system substrate-specific component